MVQIKRESELNGFFHRWGNTIYALAPPRRECGALIWLPDYCGCHGIACTYYHVAPVYGRLAPSEKTHDRSPVNPSTALAEPTTTRNGNHPELSHRIVPCSPIEAAEAQPAHAYARLALDSEIYAPRASERNWIEGGNISPSLLRAFTSPYPHLHLSSHHVCSHKSTLMLDRARVGRISRPVIGRSGRLLLPQLRNY